MATFTNRGGKWQVKVRKDGVSRSATFPTKKEAQAWATALEAEINSLKYGNIPKKTFGEIVARYLDEVTPTKKGARSEHYRLERMLGLGDDKAGKPRVPDELVTTLNTVLAGHHFSAWKDRRLKKVKVASVLREWATLSHVCTVAFKEWNWLSNNPLTTIIRPAEPPPRKRRYSKEEIEKLLHACGYSRDKLPVKMQARVGAVLLFAIETAMRAGEICKLRWRDYYRDRRIAELLETKNGSDREVPLSDEAVRILSQMEQLRENDNENSLIFKMSTASLDALFRKARDRCMIEDLHFHDSRREALTRLSKKLDVMTLAKMSGHKDLSILQNTYYAPDMAEFADQLN
jgi:integrase